MHAAQSAQEDRVQHSRDVWYYVSVIADDDREIVPTVAPLAMARS